MASDQERFYSELRGYQDGASIRSMRPSFADHDDPQIGKSYQRGYKEGQKDRRAFCERAAKRTGYQPSILRVQDGD